MNSAFDSVSKDVWGCVFEHVSSPRKVLPGWVSKIFANKLKNIKKRTRGMDDDLVILEIMSEIEHDIWRFGNSAVLDFFYRTIKQLFGDYILYQVLDENALSRNPAAVELHEKTFGSLINWNSFSSNPSAKEMLINNWGNVNWAYLSANPKFGKIIKENFEESQGKDIDWRMLSRNPCDEAIELLERNTDKIDWLQLCDNRNPQITRILEKNMDRIDWEILSLNPAAVKLLEKNPDKVDWRVISCNEGAVHVIEKNTDRIDWDMLSMNKSALPLLVQNLEKVNWRFANRNPSFIPILEEMNKFYPAIGTNDLGRQTRIFWLELAINPDLYTYDRKAYRKAKERFVKKMIML